MHVLVFGSTGVPGSALLPYLRTRGLDVQGYARKKKADVHAGPARISTAHVYDGVAPHREDGITPNELLCSPNTLVSWR